MIHSTAVFNRYFWKIVPLRKKLSYLYLRQKNKT